MGIFQEITAAERRKFTMILVVLALISSSVRANPGLSITSPFQDEDWFDFCKEPAMSLSYGSTINSLDFLEGDLTSPAVAGITLGSLCEEPIEEDSPVVDYHYNYLAIGRMSGELGGSSETGGIDLNYWRVTTADQEGWGYRFAFGAVEPGVVFFHTQGLHWDYIDSEDDISLPADRRRMSLYDESVRFGTTMAAGVRLKPVQFLGIDVAYERAITFQRTLVLKWLVSEAVEGVGHSILDTFIGEVMDSSPGAAPIVGFVLKNGFSYAMYELRRTNMNFPFEGAAPLLNETVKMGLTFMF